jgi:hypothetical protein
MHANSPQPPPMHANSPQHPNRNLCGKLKAERWCYSAAAQCSCEATLEQVGQGRSRRAIPPASPTAPVHAASWHHHDHHRHPNIHTLSAPTRGDSHHLALVPHSRQHIGKSAEVGNGGAQHLVPECACGRQGRQA